MKIFEGAIPLKSLDLCSIYFVCLSFRPMTDFLVECSRKDLQRSRFPARFPFIFSPGVVVGGGKGAPPEWWTAAAAAALVSFHRRSATAIDQSCAADRRVLRTARAFLSGSKKSARITRGSFLVPTVSVPQDKRRKKTVPRAHPPAHLWIFSEPAQTHRVDGVMVLR